MAAHSMASFERLIYDAQQEILRQRHVIEIQNAKLEMIDLFAAVFHTVPPQRTVAATVDVAVQLQEALAVFQADRDPYAPQRAHVRER